MPSSIIAPDFWSLYQREQKKLDSLVLDEKSFAREDSIFKLLEESKNGVTSQAASDLFNSHAGRCLNRRRTLFHRSKLQRERFLDISKSVHVFTHNGERVLIPAADDPGMSVERENLISQIQTQIDDSDWELLFSLASGNTYMSLSESSGVPVSTLKSKASRCRSNLRKKILV